MINGAELNSILIYWTNLDRVWSSKIFRKYLKLSSLIWNDNCANFKLFTCLKYQFQFPLQSVCISQRLKRAATANLLPNSVKDQKSKSSKDQIYINREKFGLKKKSNQTLSGQEI